MAPTNTNELFSISPAEIAATASTWQGEGDVVSALDFSALSSVSGDGSRTFAAVQGCDGPAKAATDSIGSRLTSLGDNLHRFKVTTIENDRASAGAFTKMMPR